MNMTDVLNAFNARVCEINKTLPKLTDEIAITVVELFPTWKADTDYAVDMRIKYNDKLYRVVQTHTSQDDWTPDITPALYTEVAKPGEIPVWKQPTGAQDAYMTGEKVHYPTAEDDIYICTTDYNVYAPDVYGWERQNGGE